MEKMQRFCWLIFFVLTPLTLSAQNRTIDSLKSALAVSGKHDDFKILWELAYEYVTVDKKTAFKYADDTQASALKAGDSLYVVKAKRMMGQLLRFWDKLDESLIMLNAALTIAQRNGFSQEIAYISNALGNDYSLLFEFDKALEFNFKALVFYETEGDIQRAGRTLMNIGFVHYRMGSSTEAIDYFKRSLDLKFQCGDKLDLDLLYSNLGFCYAENNNVKEARAFFEKALNTCTPNCSNRIMIQLQMGLAKTFVIEKDYERAEIHYLSALRSSHNDSDQRTEIELAQELIDLYFLRNDLKKVAFYFKYVESLPEYDQYSTFNFEFLKQKAEYYRRLGDFESANSFQKKYSETIEKERGNERSLSLVKIKAQFIERENIARINEQKQRLALQEQALSQQRVLNLLIGAVIMLTIAIIIILIKANRRKQAINELLDQKVRQRTIELERNRDQLEHTHNEQAVILNKVSVDLVASLATIKGLSEIAYAELPQHEAVFFKKAESMTERMVDYMKNYSQVR